MATPERFRLAMEMCVGAFATETAPDVKRHLASTALLFAQVAEHLERGNPVTRDMATRCSQAVSLIADERMRTKIAVLLSDLE